VAAAGSFGAIPLFTGTLMVSAIALLVAVPIGLMSAIYLSEYASRRTRSVAKPLLEMLAGIPTVVYGFFAALTMAPLLRSLGESMGLTVASESALAAGLVMGVMIIPFVSSLSDDVINAVPQDLRNGSYALGATRSETVTRVVLRAALPGIVGGVLLAVSRAIGETMIVVMAAGLSANLTANPLDSVTTVTVQIVTLLTGDQEFDSAKTLAAFALGLTLFVFTLGLNLIALHTVRKYREHHRPHQRRSGAPLCARATLPAPRAAGCVHRHRLRVDSVHRHLPQGPYGVPADGDPPGHRLRPGSDRSGR
jgi:phosphate transport system permease protein